MCESSVDSAFRNFFRAGVLKKRSRTVIEVPGGSPASSTRAIFPPLISITVPAGSSAARVSSRKRDTEAIDGNASPRNPRVVTLSRSSAFLIFEVACRSNASMASSRTMPHPLSVIWINFFPPASTLSLIRVAPASSEFSSISFTTDAGRSTTSPAAIWFATVSESTWILPIGRAVLRDRDQWSVSQKLPKKQNRQHHTDQVSDKGSISQTVSENPALRGGIADTTFEKKLVSRLFLRWPCTCIFCSGRSS